MIAVDGTDLGIGALATGLAGAFGTAVVLLTKGTERLDKAGVVRIESLAAELTRCRTDLAAIEAARDHWRNEAYRLAGLAHVAPQLPPNPTPEATTP